MSTSTSESCSKSKTQRQVRLLSKFVARRRSISVGRWSNMQGALDEDNEAPVRTNSNSLLIPDQANHSSNSLQQQQQQQDERLFCPAGGTVASSARPPGAMRARGACKQPTEEDDKDDALLARPQARWRRGRRRRGRQLRGVQVAPPPISSRVVFHIAILLLGCSLSLVLLASVSGSSAAARRAESPQQQRALLQSANVELTRRSLQRAQRETQPASANSIELTLGGGQSQQPTCGYPGSPAHASVTFNSTHVVAGTAASYTCDNGYELLGPPRRICQSNGSWSPIGIPFCVLNVGLGKAAMQSSTAGHGSAQKAVDGSTSPYFQASTCTMTDVEHNPWWYVNLLEPYLVQIVRIDFGQACCANRQKATIAVRVGNNRPDLGNNPLCNRYHGFIEEGKPLFLPCTRPAPGAFVSIHLEAPSGSSLSICETFIYTDHALSIEQCPSFRDQPLGSTATYNGKCYLFHNNQALEFEGARKYCESRGGTLVDETSPALQGFLSWELYRRHRNDQLMGQYWLGAVKDTRQPQNWKWISGKDVQISFWNSLTNQGNCSRFDGSKGWLWSDTDCSAQLNFICQYRPLSCGKPEKPTNSTLLTKNIDNGTVIEYQCAPGSLLMGPKSRVCLPTGFFSEFAPKCKYVDCQFPAMIPNGDYRLLNASTSYQSTVNYFCREGYQLYGRSTLTCDVDERWNGPPPRCEPLLCSAPVAPSNGYVTVTSNITIAGSQATYDCRPGYELVGERLLSCLSSGTWDNSFPYCREKRLPPHVIQLPGGNAPAPSTNRQPASSAATKPLARPPPSQMNGASSVHFPTGSSGSVRPASGTQTAPPPTTMVSGGSSSSSSSTSTLSSAQQPPTSLPASLNGLAGQFVTPIAIGAQPSGQQVAPNLNEIPTSSSNELGQRRPLAANSQTVASDRVETVAAGQQRQTSQLAGSNAPTAASSSAPAITSSSNRQQSGAPSSGSRQFPHVLSGASSTTGGYDSLATTNSVSVHSSTSLPSSAGTTASGSSTTTSAGSSSSTPFFSGNTHFGVGQPSGNVLASLGAPIPSLRTHPHHHQASISASSHNALANAKYSLDGIIAVAIFGGFIFLGAIITILVIIIRRKSSQSSSIDAQTISTYDSANGADNHNGLYRNYQQAWDNLRFATPASQPKLSGNVNGNGVSLITAHVSGGPSIGLKNYASPGVMLHHHHHHQQLAHTASGHNNLGMSSSVDSSSSSSSHSSSSMGANGGAGSGGADPLLGPSHAHHNHHHHMHQPTGAHLHHHHHHRLSHHQLDEADDDDDDEQGVISADEANYAPRHFNASQLVNGAHHHRHQHHGSHHEHEEGFRDTTELTINADTAAMPTSSAARRRLYSANQASSASIGRSSLAPANRRSLSNLNQQQSGDQQNQRLVITSSTSSNSTRSSRTSPPSDDHSLDRLAYGNSWHNHKLNT